MKFIADLHIHSKYSRATSKHMEIDTIAKWAKIKGIDLIGTGDFTHPMWFKHLRETLKSTSDGLLEHNGVKFLLTAEISNMYTKNNRGRRIHTLIFAPDFDSAGKLNKRLAARGNVVSDGRPIFGFDVKDLVKMSLDISEDFLIIPAHAWTPWFSVFGSKSGFDSIEECFEEEAKNIYALETGLSSDPAMNWRVSALDKYTLISNSDAHSPAKLGREANVFDCKLTYKDVISTIKNKDKNKLLFTVEFFPEEGKYHFDGHRNCNIRFSPKETKKNNNKCPKCNRELTVGVMSRVDDLADREEGFIPKNASGYKSLVPLAEIIAESLQKGVNTKTVASEYEAAIAHFGNEFGILLDASEKEIEKHLSENTAKAIMRVRKGDLVIEPGFDGEYGKVKIFKQGELTKKRTKQLELF